MKRTILKKVMADTYFRLVKTFPLTRIRNDDHFEEALSFIDDLLKRHRDSGEEQYLDVLTDLVERYEDEAIPFPDSNESDMLRELIRANGSNQTLLAAETGIAQSTISAVLSGSRSLTKPQVAALAKRFRVSPAAFFPQLQ